MMPRFQFGNVVIVEDDQVGVIVKSWVDDSHEVYVRSYNGLRIYKAEDIQHFIYGKYLSDEEKEFYPGQ